MDKWTLEQNRKCRNRPKSIQKFATYLIKVALQIIRKRWIKTKKDTGTNWTVIGKN